MTKHQNIAEWHGKDLVDRDGKKIGKLEDVYVDVETDEPMFGTVKEGLFARHLTFVPLRGLTIGPNNIQVAVSKEQVEDAPNIDMHDADFVKEASKRGAFAYITDAEAKDWQNSIDIVLRRFAEYHDLEGAFGRAITERAKGASAT